MIYGWQVIGIWSRLEVGQNFEKMKVLRMSLPIVGLLAGSVVTFLAY
jgi:hypothetical protein